jgi:hypothetical protein
MNIEILIGIVSIFIGLPTLIQYLTHKTPVFIYVQDETINLFNEIKGNIDELDISFKGNKVNKNIFLIKSYVFYRGDKDVIKTDIYDKFSILLVDRSVVHNFRILKCTERLNVNIEVIEGRIVFDFDLLKNNDFFYFECLIENKSNEHPSKWFKPDYRIANVRPLDTLNSSTIRMTGSNVYFALFLPIIIFLTFLYTIVSGIDLVPLDSDLMAVEIRLKGKEISVDSLINVIESNNAKIELYNSLGKLEKKPNNILEYEKLNGSVIGLSKGIKEQYELFKRDHNMLQWIINDEERFYKINDWFSIHFKLNKFKYLFLEFFLILMNVFMGFILFPKFSKSWKYQSIIKFIDSNSGKRI